MILDGMQPAAVLRYFEEISAIPRGSGNMEGIVGYCTAFAREHGLACIRDEAGNVLIRKPATPGYEDAEGVVIQGHMDMVCVSAEGRTADFEKEGIHLCTDGENVWADGTSLGGDDGIALACALAVLAADDIPHPKLEALFTVDEEIGLLGAARFDPFSLEGTRMLNIDSEKEGILTVSCAGGVRADVTLPLSAQEAKGAAYALLVGGLLGGHSGSDIHKNRTNAIKLLGRILNHLGKETPLLLASLAGGEKDNAIAAGAKAVFCVPEGEERTFEAAFAAYRETLLTELAATEPGLALSLCPAPMPERVFDAAGTKKAVFLLYQCPYGVVTWSTAIPGFVLTSLNAGVLQSDAAGVSLGFSLRSSVASELQELKERIVSLADLLGADVAFSGEYPGWEYREDSALRDLAVRAYENVYGEKPQVLGIHAGLECGIFVGKRPELDCISFGPDLQDVHTPKEKLNVASVGRTWDFLLELLKILA